jgi:hypothetical protein
MSYVDDHLLPGEAVTHRAHLHKLAFLMPALASLALVMLGVVLIVSDLVGAGLVPLAAAAVPLLWAYIEYRTSEFAVTDKRVVIKVGWIQRRTLETMLSKVEAVGVDQTLLGRVLGYGTITVTGTGGTKEQFANIANPLEFRRRVQTQVGIAEDSRQRIMVPADGGVVAVPGAPRQERECPYCAELILAKARVCKHCNREVQPIA